MSEINSMQQITPRFYTPRKQGHIRKIMSHTGAPSPPLVHCSVCFTMIFIVFRWNVLISRWFSWFVQVRRPVLEAAWRSWRALGALGGILKALWSHLGTLEGILEASWALLEPCWPKMQLRRALDLHWTRRSQERGRRNPVAWATKGSILKGI